MSDCNFKPYKLGMDIKSLTGYNPDRSNFTKEFKYNLIKEDSNINRVKDIVIMLQKRYYYLPSMENPNQIIKGVISLATSAVEKPNQDAIVRRTTLISINPEDLKEEYTKKEYEYSPIIINKPIIKFPIPLTTFISTDGILTRMFYPIPTSSTSLTPGSSDLSDATDDDQPVPEIEELPGSSDSLPPLSPKPRVKRVKRKLKPCEKAKFSSNDAATLLTFKECLYHHKDRHILFIIYVQEVKLAKLARIFGAMDVSQYEITSGGKGNLFQTNVMDHLMSFGTDLFLTNQLAVYSNVVATYKAAILQSSPSNMLIDLISRNSDIYVLLERMSIPKLTHAISQIINTYVGKDVSIKLLCNDRQISYTLGTLIPITYLKLIYNL